MLHVFLLNERDEILALCARKIINSSDRKISNAEIETGLALFYDELIEVLVQAELESSIGEKEANAFDRNGRNSAVQYGEDSLKIGYTVSQVVHGYGSICQSITEYAQLKNEPITVKEFSYLNLYLDIAIAESVTAYDRVQRDSVDREEVRRLGFLAHELRNALSNAVMAFTMIKKGSVGVGGNTGHVLESALGRMRQLIDRSLAEVRLRSFPAIDRRKAQVLQLVSDVEASASADASAKSILFSIDVSPDIVINADHHFMVSALGNLVQNAIKFTKTGGVIWIRARESGHRVIIEIEDQCGGLPSEKIAKLFQPVAQIDADRLDGGLGIGLTICKHAVSINEGVLSARDVPGEGCIFSIDLPSSNHSN